MKKIIDALQLSITANVPCSFTAKECAKIWAEIERLKWFEEEIEKLAVFLAIHGVDGYSMGENKEIK